MSAVMSWFLKSSIAGKVSGAFMFSPWSERGEAGRGCRSGHEHDALADFVAVYRREYFVDLVQRTFGYERRNLHFAVQHQVQRGRVLLGRAAPVADRAGVESHQVGQSHLDLVHGE